MLVLNYSWFKPDTDRLVVYRKAVFQAPLALVCRDTSRFPIVFGPSPLNAFLETLSAIFAFVAETFLSDELVAMLAVSCAWVFRPDAGTRLRPGLPPPPWLKAWLLLFRVLHWGVVNAMYAKFGTQAGMVPLRGAIVMWGVAIMMALGMLAVFVGKAMLKDALDDMRSSSWKGGNTYAKPILRGEGVVEGAVKLKRE